MSILKVGDFDQIDMTLRELPKITKMKHVRYHNSFTIHNSSQFLSHDTSGIIRDSKPYKVDLVKSKERWGLFLKNISLFKSFEGIKGIINPQNEIYFSSIVWDYSGNIPFVYPPEKASSSDFCFRIREKNTHQFIGDGIVLWPPQTIVGSLNVVIFIYESDEKIRDVGKLLGEIHRAVQASELAHQISTISADPKLIAGVAVGAVVDKLVDAVGKIMESNKNDYVDLFQGSYRINRLLESKIEKCDHEFAGIELEFAVT